MTKPKPRPRPKPCYLAALALVFLAGCVLTGCAQMGMNMMPMEPIAVPQTLPEAGKEAQKVINEANVLLAAAYDVVRDKRKDRLITKAEAFRHLDTLDDYSEKVDEAQKALDVGDFTLAKTRAEATKLLIEKLRSKVAEKARQP